MAAIYSLKAQNEGMRKFGSNFYVNDFNFGLFGPNEWKRQKEEGNAEIN